jgi:hypothetical protein
MAWCVKSGNTWSITFVTGENPRIAGALVPIKKDLKGNLGQGAASDASVFFQRCKHRAVSASKLPNDWLGQQPYFEAGVV